MIAPHVPVKPHAVGPDPVDPVLGHPEPFLIGEEERPIRVQANAVGCAEAGGEDVGTRAIGRHAQERAMMRNSRGQSVAGGLGVIEVAVGIGLQAHRELMEVVGNLMVAVDIFIIIRFAVGVEVMQADDLISAADVDLAVHHLQPQRLKQTGGDSAPCEFTVRLIETRDHPDIAIPGANRGGMSVRHEVETGRAHQRKPGIGNGERKRVGGEGTVIRSVSSCVCRMSGHRLGPPRVSGSSGSGGDEIGGSSEWRLRPLLVIKSFTRRVELEPGRRSCRILSSTTSVADRSPSTWADTDEGATRMVSGLVDGPISSVRGEYRYIRTSEIGLDAGRV